eukprot:4900005-Alexandrium_andersonii.AAC.1
MRHILRGRRFGGSFASINLRLPELQRRIGDDHQVLQSLIEELQASSRKPWVWCVRSVSTAIHGPRGPVLR